MLLVLDQPIIPELTFIFIFITRLFDTVWNILKEIFEQVNEIN